VVGYKGLYKVLLMSMCVYVIAFYKSFSKVEWKKIVVIVLAFQL